MRWDDLRFLLELHRHGSHARAGRALGVDASTVGRKLASLERALGTPLVRRMAEGHALTQAAHALLPAIERMEAGAVDIDRLARGWSGGERPSPVRLTAGDGLMNYVLIPKLADFCARYPNIHVDVIGDLGVLDIVRREADVALRLVRPTGESLIAKKLPRRLAHGIYATESYLRARGRPASQSDLQGHDWLDYAETGARDPGMTWLHEHIAGAKVAIRTTSTSALVRACAAGLGLAVTYACVAEGEPRLVRVLPRLELPEREAWVVYHRDDKRNTAVQAVVAWLREALG